MSTLAALRFTPGVRRTLRRLCSIVCPDELEQLGIADEVVDRTELFVRSLAPLPRAAVVVGTLAFEGLALTWPRGGLRPFSALPPEVARDYFAAWWSSPLPPFSAFALGIKSMLNLSYYEHPQVWQRLDYHPDRWAQQVSRRRATRWADEIADHEQLLRAPDPLKEPDR